MTIHYNLLKSIKILVCTVIMDSNLKFHTHSSAVANKANQILGLIRKSFTNLNRHILASSTLSLMRPHLESVKNAVWGGGYLCNWFKHLCKGELQGMFKILPSYLIMINSYISESSYSFLQLYHRYRTDMNLVCLRCM